MWVLGARLGCATLGLIAWSIAAQAETVADFYRNKTLTVIVITAPGGTYAIRSAPCAFCSLCISIAFPTSRR